ncbi:MAG TPA: pyridoxamine 5'-phosphate oxidase [Cyclobacteriaceae bacterium]|jgi:pyridoxamine-phosphate oxidase
MDEQDIGKIRREYSSSRLDENSVSEDPFVQFKEWMQDAIKSNIIEPTAMNLATATIDGRPSSRIVLLKETSGIGFVFYTNYQSQKGLEIEQNPFGALNFFWVSLERQVRIEGVIEKISFEESDAYFRERPRGSQIGAWTSPQSQRIANREILEQRNQEMEKRFHDKEVPRPAQWGGYILVPNMFEFWQGRENRLHDRIQYTLQKDNNWLINRVAP